VATDHQGQGQDQQYKPDEDLQRSGGTSDQKEQCDERDEYYGELQNEPTHVGTPPFEVTLVCDRIVQLMHRCSKESVIKRRESSAP
jgi:hypothetical protein